MSTVLYNDPSIGEGKYNPCYNSTLANDSITSRIQNIQSNFETIFLKHKQLEHSSVRETITINVIDEYITEKDQSTTKVDTIKSQSNILDNTTAINDDKDYACDLNMLTDDSDTVRIHRSRSNFDLKNQSKILLDRILLAKS